MTENHLHAPSKVFWLEREKEISQISEEKNITKGNQEFLHGSLKGNGPCGNSIPLVF